MVGNKINVVLWAMSVLQIVIGVSEVLSGTSEYCVARKCSSEQRVCLLRTTGIIIDRRERSIFEVTGQVMMISW